MHEHNRSGNDNRSTNTNEAGFTLIELLASTVLTMIMMAAVASVFRMQIHTVKVQENRLEAVEYARAVLDMNIREMRNTGYFPAGSCTTNPTHTGGIVAATAQSFQFVYDANGTNGCADADENVVYAYDSANKNVTRNGLPLTDGNATGLQFTYYPQQTTAAAPPPFCFTTNQPAGCSGNVASNLANIQRVAVTVVIESKNPNPTFGGQLTATFTSNIDLRNRGLSS